MPPLSPLTDNQVPEAAQSAFQDLRAKMGQVINIYRVMAHAPEVLHASLAMSQATKGDLDPKLKELAHLKTSQVNGCEY